MLVRAAPLAWGALAFGAGLLVCDHASFPWSVHAASAALFAALAGLAIRRGREGLSWLFALLALAALAGGYLSLLRSQNPADFFSTPGRVTRDATVMGTISSTPASSVEDPVTWFKLAPRRLAFAGMERPLPPGRISVTLNWRALGLDYGDLLEISGSLRVPGAPTNPGQTDSRARYRREGILAGLSCWDSEKMRVLERGRGNPFLQRLEWIRAWAVNRVVGLVGAPRGHLLASMLFGAKAGLSPDVLDAFRDTGLMHVLVTSGLHVGLLAWLCLALFSRLRASRRSAALLTLPVLAGYLALCGAQPPLLRSTLMFSLLIAGEGLGRGRSAVNSLGLAALAILLAAPEKLWDPSFNFSFAATFGILTLAPWLISRRGKIPLPLAQVAACTLAAQLALLPLLAAYFQKASFLGTFANLLIIPAMALFLAAGFVLLGLSWIPGVAQILGLLVGWLLAGAETLVNFFAQLPLASVIVPPFSPAAQVAYCAWLLGFLAWRAGPFTGRIPVPRWPRLLCLGGVAGLCLLVWRAALAPGPGNLTATFLDVGHGLAVVIRLPSGRTVLFDSGSAYAGHAIVAPFIKTSGVGRLAAIVLSHPHSDHLGGLTPVLRQLPADSIYCASGGSGNGIDSERLGKLLTKRRAVCRQVRAGDEISGEPKVRIRFLYPSPRPSKGARAGSASSGDEPVVLAVSYGKAYLLLTGDISSRIERALESSVPRPGSDLLLQVPHHGSAESSSRTFLAAICPHHAVISAAKFRRSPHPHPATVIRLREQGALIWNTAQSGALAATADESGWTIVPATPQSGRAF